MPENLLDLQNIVTAVELESILDKQLEYLFAHPETAGRLSPLMIWGAPGVGKSSIIRKVAEKHKIGFIDIRLAQREPVDIRGLPVPDGDSVRWLVSSDWPRDPESKGIIFFDELTAADRSLQVAAYELILDRRLGELYQVPKGWYICGAGNRVEDNAVAVAMSSALANRFMHVELREDVESWIKWGLLNSIHPAVLGFIRFRPELLFHQEGENIERGWPSPRSWERVSIAIDSFGGEWSELLRKMIYGLIGRASGIEFAAFFEKYDRYKDIREAMLDSSKNIRIPEPPAERYAFCSAVTTYLWSGKDQEEEGRLVDGFFRILPKLPKAFSTMMVMDAMAETKIHTSLEAVRIITSHPAFKDWQKTTGGSFRIG